MKIEIIKDELAPGGEGASLGAARTKDGEEGFATKALGVHAGEMTQPAESAGTEQGDNGREAAFLLHGNVGDSAVGGVGDAQHVSGTAHLEGLKTADVDDVWSPSLGAPQEGGQDSGLEDGDFGSKGDVLATVKGSSQSPKALVCLFEAGGDLGLEFRLSGEGATEIFEGGEESFGFRLGFGQRLGQ